ncbi:MAG: 3-deoxy-7-phosphoheptulonate synthase, partial [Nostoc sp.]
LSLEDMVHLVDSLKPVATAVGRNISEAIGAGLKPAPIFCAV